MPRTLRVAGSLLALGVVIRDESSFMTTRLKKSLASGWRSLGWMASARWLILAGCGASVLLGCQEEAERFRGDARMHCDHLDFHLERAVSDIDAQAKRTEDQEQYWTHLKLQGVASLPTYNWFAFCHDAYDSADSGDEYQKLRTRFGVLHQEMRENSAWISPAATPEQLKQIRVRIAEMKTLLAQVTAREL